MSQTKISASVDLVCGDCRATVSPLGAELRTLSVAGRSLLWESDPDVWDAVAPILFPVVGWTRGGVVRIDGRTYALGLHGFARHRHFVIEQRSPDHVRLVDHDDDETWNVYPYRFRFSVDVHLQPDGVFCRVSVVNKGGDAMPYAVGLHPGFCWPHQATARLTFDKPERAMVSVITDDGLFAAAERPVPLEGRALPLTRELMAQEALCFLHTRSRALTYEADAWGRLRIEHDFPHLALWSRASAPFLCIESWTGHGDPADFAGELRDKPSMLILAPGEMRQHSAAYKFEPLA